MDDSERWKSLDAASYDQLAEQFDVFSTRLSAGAARRLLDLAEVKSGDRVLDVGTGAGLLPFELVRRGVAVRSVIGIDLSTGMIGAARRKAHAAGVPESLLRFEQMDAERLTFDDASFDLVMSAFALTHVPHPEQALREMVRVLRPGGRLVIAVGSRPPFLSTDLLVHGAREVRRRLQQGMGRRLTADLLDRIVVEECGPAPHDLPRGSALSRSLDRAPLLVRLVRQAGLVDVRQSWRNNQNQVDAADEYWELHRTIRSDSRKRLLDAEPAVVSRVRERFMATCRRTLARGGVLAFPISAVFVTARKTDAVRR
jgi:ubiquinone/menaquinone biosynthesis C-methylase UbiE